MSSNVRSSLIYQVLMHGHRAYAVIFFIILVFLYVYKGIRGNLTETPVFLAFSLLLSVPVLLILVYLGVFQNYVLLLEAVFVGISGSLVVVETIAGVALCATLSTLVLRIFWPGVGSTTEQSFNM